MGFHSVCLMCRAISVLLGDHWKKLTGEERRVYIQEAKLLADQQKRLHPDCWKRKRSVSTSVCVLYYGYAIGLSTFRIFSPGDNQILVYCIKVITKKLDPQMWESLLNVGKLTALQALFYKFDVGTLLALIH